MNVFITGACGYIGYSVVKSLLEKSFVTNLVIYDNLAKKNSTFFIGSSFSGSTKMKFIQGNILDNHSLQQHLQGIDVVIHLAAKVTTPFADYHAHEFDQVNHWGTACLLDAIEEIEQIKHVIYLSSIAVYGNSRGVEIDETVTPAPQSFYGSSKLRAERQIHRLVGKKSFNIIRGGNVYGFNPCIRMDAAMNRLLFDAHLKGMVHVNGDGEQKRAFLHLDYLVDVICSLVKEPNVFPQMFNLVTRNLAINEIVAELEKIYPDLEKNYLNRHMQMRSIAAKTQYANLIQDTSTSLKDELQQIKSNFSF